MDLSLGTVAIQNPDGKAVGAGFLASHDGLVATCAHVVTNARGIPDGKITLKFLCDPAAKTYKAAVVKNWWRDISHGDIAILKLEGKPHAEAQPLLLGSSAGTRRHPFSVLGFPNISGESSAESSGNIHTDYDTAIGTVAGQARVKNQDLLTVEAGALTAGYSGGAAWDELRRRVIGMAVMVAETDSLGKRSETAYLIPTEQLQDLCLDLIPSDICPYQGLRYFDEQSAEFFHGRETALKELKVRITDDPRFLAVLGPSGSGKSSLVRAGLIPFLRATAKSNGKTLSVFVAKPGQNPFIEERQRDGLQNHVDLITFYKEWQAQNPPETGLVIIFDQFEELFVNVSPDQRPAFVKNLLALIDDHPSFTVVIIMRDDFYSQFQAEATLLARWLERGLVNIPLNLSRDDLRAVIEKPALATGWRFDPPDLVRDLIDQSIEAVPLKKADPDFASSCVLPLLQATLKTLWQRRQDGALHSAALKAVGGVTGSLNQWATAAHDELVREENLSEDERRMLASMLVELVYVVDETQALRDSRRRVRITDLCARYPENARVKIRSWITFLADGRLLLTAGDTVELIHDSLIFRWTLMEKWLESSRRFKLWQQKVADSLKDWKHSNPTLSEKRHSELLLKNHDIDRASEWLTAPGIYLSQDERDFIQAAIAFRTSQENAEHARQEQELYTARQLQVAEAGRAEEARKRAEEAEQYSKEQQRTNTQIKKKNEWLGFATGIATVLAFAAVLATLSLKEKVKEAVEARETANQAKTNALVAEAKAENYSGQLSLALTNSEALRLASLVATESKQDPDLALLIAAKAHEIAPSGQTEYAMLEALSRRPHYAGSLNVQVREDTGATVLLSSEEILTSNPDGTVTLWNARTLKPEKTNASPGLASGSPTRSLAVSPDHEWIASISDDGILHVSKLSDGGPVYTNRALERDFNRPFFGPFSGPELCPLYFSPDSRRLYFARDGHALASVDLRSGEIKELLNVQETGIYASIRSIDVYDDLVLTASGEAIYLYSSATETKRRLSFSDVFIVDAKFISKQHLAILTAEGYLYSYNVDTREFTPRIAAHSLGNGRLATTARRDIIATFGHSTNEAATGEVELGLRVWRTDQLVDGNNPAPLHDFRVKGSDILSLSISLDGRMLVSLTSESCQLWRLDSPWPMLETMPRITFDASTSRHTLVSRPNRSSVILIDKHKEFWELGPEGLPRRIKIPNAYDIQGKTPDALAFSPDGSVFAIRSRDEITLFDSAVSNITGKLPVPVGSSLAGSLLVRSNWVASSGQIETPNGKLTVIHLWNLLSQPPRCRTLRYPTIERPIMLAGPADASMLLTDDSESYRVAMWNFLPGRNLNLIPLPESRYAVDFYFSESHRSLIFTEDGGAIKRIAFRPDNEVLRSEVIIQNAGSFPRIALNSEETVLAVENNANQVTLYSTNGVKISPSWDSGLGAMHSLSMLRQKTLISGHSNGTVGRWNFEPKALAHLCLTLAGRDFTPDERWRINLQSDTPQAAQTVSTNLGVNDWALAQFWFPSNPQSLIEANFPPLLHSPPLCLLITNIIENTPTDREILENYAKIITATPLLLSGEQAQWAIKEIHCMGREIRAAMIMLALTGDLGHLHHLKDLQMDDLTLSEAKIQAWATSFLERHGRHMTLAALFPGSDLPAMGYWYPLAWPDGIQEMVDWTTINPSQTNVIWPGPQFFRSYMDQAQSISFQSYLLLGVHKENWMNHFSQKLLTNHPQAALALAEQAITRSPTNILSYRLKGAALENLGRLSQAIDSFQEAISRGSPERALRAKVADYHWSLGDTNKAEKYFRDGASTNIRTSIGLNAAQNRLAWFLVTTYPNDKDKAKEALELSLQSRKHRLRELEDYYLKTLAACHFANGNITEAIATQKRAIEKWTSEDGSKESLEQTLKRYEEAARQ